MKQCKKVITNLGYDSTKQGKLIGLILCQCLPAGWKFLTGLIGKCLRHKTSSLDQLNLFEMQILYIMLKSTHLDFSHMIFDQLVSSISRMKRSFYVPYPCWFSLVLEHINSGYNGRTDDSIAKPSMSSKLINATPTPTDALIS